MELLENFATIASTWVPTLFVIAVSVVGLGLMRTVLRRSRLGGPGRLGVLSQLSLALLTAAAVIAVILALPIGDTARGQVLDALHGGGIEIVSPTFMNQRQIAADHRFIPKRRWHHPPADEASLPEEKIFDKAEEAESREQHVAELDAVEAQI